MPLTKSYKMPNVRGVSPMSRGDEFVWLNNGAGPIIKGSEPSLTPNFHDGDNPPSNDHQNIASSNRVSGGQDPSQSFRKGKGVYAHNSLLGLGLAATAVGAGLGLGKRVTGG